MKKIVTAGIQVWTNEAKLSTGEPSEQTVSRRMRENKRTAITQGELIVDELVRRFGIKTFGCELVLGNGVGAIARAVRMREGGAGVLLSEGGKVRVRLCLFVAGVLKETVGVDVLERTVGDGGDDEEMGYLPWKEPWLSRNRNKNLP